MFYEFFLGQGKCCQNHRNVMVASPAICQPAALLLQRMHTGASGYTLKKSGVPPDPVALSATA